MSYNQAMKHWKNHRKDRYFQQCFFVFSDSENLAVSESKMQKLSKASITKIIETEHAYPLYVYQNAIGIWEVVPQNHLFGTKIEYFEVLKSFANDYA